MSHVLFRGGPLNGKLRDEYLAHVGAGIRVPILRPVRPSASFPYPPSQISGYDYVEYRPLRGVQVYVTERVAKNLGAPWR